MLLVSPSTDSLFDVQSIALSQLSLSHEPRSRSSRCPESVRGDLRGQIFRTSL